MDAFEKAIHDQVNHDANEWKKERLELKPGDKYFQSISDGLTTEQAMNKIRFELQKDKEPGSYYHLWQSNIAMAFYDAAAKYAMENNINWDQQDARITHEIANTAAKNFLDNLCNQANTGQQKP